MPILHCSRKYIPVGRGSVFIDLTELLLDLNHEYWLDLPGGGRIHFEVFISTETGRIPPVAAGYRSYIDVLWCPYLTTL
jgi:hypothetical protein